MCFIPNDWLTYDANKKKTDENVAKLFPNFQFSVEKGAFKKKIDWFSVADIPLQLFRSIVVCIIFVIKLACNKLKLLSPVRMMDSFHITQIHTNKLQIGYINTCAMCFSFNTFQKQNNRKVLLNLPVAIDIVFRWQYLLIFNQKNCIKLKWAKLNTWNKRDI